MEGKDGSPARAALLRLLAGVQVGVTGGLVMLAWFALNSMLQAQRWYAVPNLLGSTFYGDLAFRSGFGKVSVVGGALHLCASGAIGALFGLFAPQGQSGFRVLLIGVVTGLAWYYLLFGAFWKVVNPMVPLYSSSRSMLVAHVLYGLWLGRWPGVLRSLEQSGVEGGRLAPDC
jgi:hypothetical protein